MKKILIMTLKLLTITIAAGLILGFVNYQTKGPIAMQAAKEADEARKAVFPEASEFEQIDFTTDDVRFEIVKDVYNAIDENGNVIGITAALVAKGYSPGLNMTVGIGADGIIKGVAILSHEETPGLGAKATEPKFIDQYKGRSYENPLVVVKTSPSKENDIEAIASATITSKGVTDAVNIAALFYKETFGGAK